MAEYGYCQCECGGLAPIASQSRTDRGWVKGKPKRYISGHHSKHHTMTHTERNTAKTIDDYPDPVVDENGCHIWQGSLNSYGYPIRGGGSRHSKPILVHREVYEKEIGPIPEGYTIDHVYDRGCRSKACINKDHLEAVTRSENTRRRWDAKRKES